VAQHMRVGLELEAGGGRCPLDHAGEAGGGERLTRRTCRTAGRDGLC
jgi:hypothetical protein